MSRFRFCLIGILVMAFAGCDRPASPAAAPVAAKPVAPPVQQVAAADELTDVKTAQPEGEPAGSEGDSQKDEAQDSETETADGEKPKEAAGRERIALLTPGGPLVVDLWITLDGRPHTSPFNELVTKVLEAAGETKEGSRATWEALAANEEFLKAHEPNQPSGASQLEMWIEQYDSNRDGQIQRGEAAAWLGRNAGRAASAFSLRSSRSYVSVPSASSRVWRLLDTDRDGFLAAAELDAADRTFWRLDANDDRVVSTAELATLRELLEATAATMEAPARDEVARYAAIRIEPDIDADRLEYLLSDLYAPRQLLGPASFIDLEETYTKLDADGDGWLERIELTDMVTMPPQLELALDFGGTTAAHRGEAKLAVRSHVPEVSILASPSPSRTVLSAGGARLIVSAHDLTGGAAGAQNREPVHLRLMVHDQSDAVFEELDANADGRLGEREISAASTRLLARDADGDGQLAASELRYSMIVAFLRGEAPQEQSFYIPSFVTAAVKADAPTWFVKADFNGDGDISRREFLGSLERFGALDENDDGYISAEEAAAFDQKAGTDSDG